MEAIIRLHKLAIELEMMGAWGLAEHVRKIIEATRREIE